MSDNISNQKDMIIRVDNEPINDSEVELINAWKLSDFTEEVNRFINSQGIEGNITRNTLNNYFKDLEEKLIHYVSRQSGVKVYTELDLKIATYIVLKRKQSKGGWQLEDIYKDIINKFEVRPFPTDNEGVEQTEQLAKDFAAIISKFTDEMTRQYEQAQELNKKSNQLLLEKSVEVQEQRIVEKQFELFNVQKQFKKEAVEKWEALPNDRRLEGLFFKREKVKEREEFIDEYIEKKLLEWFLENKLKQED